MKRFLLVLIVAVIPALFWAQPMDTSIIFKENFDATNLRMVPSKSASLGGNLGDWRVVGPGITYENWNNLPLYKSNPKAYHSPVYPTAGFSEATTSDTIPLTVGGQQAKHIYLEFDHICKTHQLDNATIYYHVVEDIAPDGSYIWSDWNLINFASNSDWYYGDAKSNNNTAISGGQFNQASYSKWQPSNADAVPDNTWWKHEMIDISRFLFQDGATPHYFQIKFRLRKNSPPGTGTENLAGWYVDNVKITLSNCELINPTITMQSPYYYNTNGFVNVTGPFNIKAKLADNDTLNLNAVKFSYEINSGSTVVVPNTNAFSNNVLNANGHSVNAVWTLPNVCYGDTIYYHIYAEDVHGSNSRFDTFLVAHHNQSNIQFNDVQVNDTLNSFPHCLFTGQPQDVTVYFVNRSDPDHSPGSGGMTSATFTMEVRDELGNLTHTSDHEWTGDICFDVPSSLSLGSFTPTKGYNYVTVYVKTRNGQLDGNHANDTVKVTAYSCDSLLNGHYTVGGANPDFATMEEVKRALEFCGLGGPVVFNFRPGTYYDFDFTQNYPGQSAVNTITFQGEDVNSVVVANNKTDAGTSTYGAVTLVNVKDYIFRNLTIQGNNTPTPSRGVFMRGNGSTNILFDGCKITAYNTNSSSEASSAVSRLAAVTAPSGTTSVNDTIVFRNCEMTGGNFGVYYKGSSTKRCYITIEDCDITSCYRGVYYENTNGGIRNNHVKQVVSNNPQDFSGIYVSSIAGADITGNTVDSVIKLDYAIYLEGAANADFYIRDNHLNVGNGANALYVKSSSSTNTVKGYILNNEIVLYPANSSDAYAMSINSSTGLNIINNSVLVKSDAPYSKSAALYIANGNGNNNTNIYNNVFANEVVCSDNSDYPIYLNGGANVTGSYNNFRSNSGVVAYKTVARNTIAEFENAMPTITNSVALNPQFTSPYNLLPVSFTGLECLRNENVLTDIRGIDRSNVTYMGAYAKPIDAFDAAVTAMISPSLGECPEPAYDITVEISNKGSQALNFASHNAVVRVVSEALNLNQPITVNTGTVPVLDRTEKVLVQNVHIPENQIVDFTFIITTNGDSNHDNDTLRQNFVLETIFPDYAEDFSNGTQGVWTIEQLAGAGNWTFQSGAGTNPAITPIYGTGRLFFNSKNFASNTKSRAILPVVTLTGSTNPVFEMWFAHDNTSNKPKEGVVVKVSTDGGLTYTPLRPLDASLTPMDWSDTLVVRYKNNATTPTWRQYTFSLSDYIANGCVFVAIDATSQGGNNINIDRIRVRNLHNNDLAVTKIYSLGEVPTQYEMRDVISATVRNEGAATQTNAPVILTVTGAQEQWSDTAYIPSLAYNTETLVTFPDHQYNIAEVKTVEVRVAADQNNDNNVQNVMMLTTQNVANVADTTSDMLLIGDYNSVIRPCVRYKTNEELSVTDVKFYYNNQAYIANPENGFRAFVANADGEILSTSELVHFSDLLPNAWNIIPIKNFALTNTVDEFYVGLEMLAQGNYLSAQVETPLRDSTFYYLNNGTYTPQLSGRFMIGAVVDTPFVNDLALLALQHPVTNCDLGHENLKIQITNNGTTDIIPPVQVHYTINGGAVVSENITDTLFSHQTTSFTFNAVEDFTNNLIDIDSSYVIKVWATKLAQDRLQFNDTLGITVVSRGKSPLPIVPDTVIVNYHTSGVLSAQLPSTISEGVIGWYTKKGYETWDFHGYSDSLTTPLIYFDTMYYATASPGTLDFKTVGTGTSSETKPFVFDRGYSRGKLLYLEDEIGVHGTISTFSLNVKTASPETAAAGIPIKIYMKTTTDNNLSTSASNWNDDLEGATLVFDDRIFFNHTGWFDINLSTPFNYDNANLIVFTETNCADYCESCNNCGVDVSGANNSYPAFNSTSESGKCVHKSYNKNAPVPSGYTAAGKRLNARFTIANLECGSEKTPIYIHVPDIPNYDVETQELLYPVPGSTTCALYDTNIKVAVKNMLNTPIPANKVVVHAIFNGTEITHTVAEPFASEEVKEVEFANTFDFSAPNANIDFSFTIFTTLNGESVVYTGNDTIEGSFTSKKTAYTPDSIVYTGTYTHSYTILELQDRSTDINRYRYYKTKADAADDANREYQTSTSNSQTSLYWETPALYRTTVYWVTGQTKTSNCETKPIKVIIKVLTPEHDLSTDNLLYPTSYQCGPLSHNLKVQVTNTDTTSGKTIPAGTFEVKADFTGSATLSGTTVISNEIPSLITDTVTFANAINLASTTQNRIYQYLIYTRPTNSSMVVYTPNDTINGTLYIPALPVAPQALTYNVAYGGTQTVAPSTSTLNHFFFYENEDDETAMADGLSFTTESIYQNTTYYYSGRIESDGFNDSVVVGNSTTKKSTPLDFSKGHSYAKVLYNKEDMAGLEGRIDSIFFYVGKADGNEVGIPMKFWLKNGEDKERLSNSNQSLNWDNETAGATLVYDGDIAWGPEGWVGFGIVGGFQYTGEGLYLYAEHDCGGENCADSYGVSPNPQFRTTSTGTNTKKVLARANNNAATSSVSFTASSDRWNTKFKMNYTCESPKATITINTNVPQHDVGVVEILAPEPQSNSFTQNEQVRVRIKNFGTQSVSNIPVSYRLADNTPVTQNHTGSLASGAEATVTFNTTCDLTGVYLPTAFMAYTGLSTDTYHRNDTVKMTLSAEDPCLSRPASSATGAHITNVSFATLNNGTAAPVFSHPVTQGNGMYTDYTQTVAPTELILGQEYTLSVAHAFTGETGKTVNKYAYIDYNRNGEYETSERVMLETSIPASDTTAVALSVVNIPANAQLGYTKMRIICATKTQSSPCGTWDGDGETEDYAILLSAPMENDLGVSKIEHPVGEFCPDDRAKVRARIKNYGTTTQILSADNALEVTATVAGATTGTYSTTVTSGAIAPDGDILVTIDDVDLGAFGNYAVTISLNYAPDQYHTNDSRAGTAVVPVGTIVEELPFVEPFDDYYDPEGPIIPSNVWEVEAGNNYTWKFHNGASPNYSSDGGPGHDNTLAYTSSEPMGVYAVVPGVNNNGNANKVTTLTSRCINMHYVNGYPVEISFSKFFIGPNNSNFEMDVLTGSGSYYKSVLDSVLTKSAGTQTSVDDEWSTHTVVLFNVDEVARLRFSMTGQKQRIDPSIDDISVEGGLPDMAVRRIVYPVDKNSIQDNCLDVNTQIRPQVEIYNNGNSAVEEFDLVIEASTANSFSEFTEHIVRHLEPGESFVYETQNTCQVTSLTKNWQILAKVVIPDDKNAYNDKGRVITCTTVSLPEYVESNDVFLGQNQPNPAYSTTKVEYIVPEPGKVTFEVVNPLGQVIYTTTQEADMDRNSVEFNVSSWAAGIYYYTLHYKDITLTKKMIVEK